MILVIDNYDSFTFNLVQYLGESGEEVRVLRNDAQGLDEISAGEVSRVVISPGPGTPAAAGKTMRFIRDFAGKIPILGVCLGHQAIGEVFGGRVVRAPAPVHGKSTVVEHDGRGIFRGLPQSLRVARYHSLIVERNSLPDCLEITALSSDGLIMGVRHREYAIEGVQFHPESVLTESGHEMIRNFS